MTPTSLAAVGASGYRYTVTWDIDTIDWRPISLDFFMAPLALQETVMAVWLIAKGFDPSAAVAQSAGSTSTPRAVASAA